MLNPGIDKRFFLRVLIHTRMFTPTAATATTARATRMTGGVKDPKSSTPELVEFGPTSIDTAEV